MAGQQYFKSAQVSSGTDDSLFTHELRAPVPRSVFDLSHIHSFSGDFGQLQPFCLIDCLPNDTFTLSNIIKATTLPLVSPLYNSIKIKTWWFYVPYYLVWHHFDRFISGGRDGTYSVIPPLLGDSTTGVTFDRGSLADYFGLPVGVHIPPEDCPSALPFMAYQRIYRDYFLNQDVQTQDNVNNWFPEDDFDFQLSDGYQMSIAPTDSTDHEPISLTALRYRNWSADYFTSAMFSEQRGPATAMPITLSGQGNNDVHVDISPDGVKDGQSFVFDSSYPYGFHVNDGGYLSVFYNNTLVHPDGHSGLGTLGDDTSHAYVRFGSGDKSPRFRSPLVVSKSDLSSYMSTSSGGFLIDDLRMATQLQLWLERNMRTKAQYNEFLRTHFNDAPVDMRLTKPYYIGGTTQMFQVSDVVQQSETTESSVQGHKTANADSFSSQFVGKFHSHEYGLIMGLMAIMPDSMYTQGMERSWSKRSRFDYYFPEFAQLSPQAILTKELYTSDSTSTNNTVFGYQGRFDEYRQKRNYVTNLLRDPTNLDFYTYTLARQFDSAPTLSPEFINSEGTVRHDVFASGTTLPPFIIQVGIGCRAVRPLPYINAPMGLL